MAVCEEWCNLIIRELNQKVTHQLQCGFSRRPHSRFHATQTSGLLPATPCTYILLAVKGSFLMLVVQGVVKCCTVLPLETGRESVPLSLWEPSELHIPLRCHLIRRLERRTLDQLSNGEYPCLSHQCSGAFKRPKVTWPGLSFPQQFIIPTVPSPSLTCFKVHKIVVLGTFSPW